MRPERIVKRLLRVADLACYRTGLRTLEGLTLPDFLGLGPGQTGSTWMYRHLSSHPQLFLPSRKELNYFDRQLHDWSLAEYANWFEPAGGRVAGEITPGYSVLAKERIALVRRLVPDVRLILTVRDPVERSWSAARRVLEKLGTTVEELGEERFFEYLGTEWSYRPEYGPTVTGAYEPGVLEGHYSRIIDNWLEHFPAEQLQIVFFGQMVEDPEGYLATICRHLGVSTEVVWDEAALRRPVNSNPRSELPEHIRGFLEEMYRDEIERLRARFGEPARRWLGDPGTGPRNDGREDSV